MLRYITILLLSISFIPLIAQTPTLFFSEYIEGSGNNRALELYNPMEVQVSLDEYRLVIAKNGGGWSDYFNFKTAAVIGPYSTYVLLHSSADSKLFPPENADELMLAGSGPQFTGDDAIALMKISLNDTVIVDLIGDPDADPGFSWPVAGNANGTYEQSLVRKETIYFGNVDWISSAGTTAENSEWIVMPKDDFTDLGKHTFNPLILINSLNITTEGSNYEINTDAGTLQCYVIIIPENASNQMISWLSTSPSIAVVNKDGLVTAFNDGEVYIKVFANDGSQAKDSLLLTISNQSGRIPVSAINVYSEGLIDSIRINKGTLQMTAGVMPGNVTVRTVSWSVSDEKIAVINTNGLLTAVDNGNLFVYAEATDGTGIRGLKQINVSGQFFELPGIGEVRAAGISENSIYKISNEVILTFKIFTDNKKYVQDASGGFEIYDPDGIISTNYEIGDGISGLTGYMQDYFGMMQFVPTMDPGPPGSKNNQINFQTIGINEFNTNFENYESELVRITNLTFIDAGNYFLENLNYKAFNGNDTIVFRTQFATDINGTLIPHNVNIRGLAIEFNATPKLAARSMADIEVLGSTGLGQAITDSELLVFPNPSSDYLNINRKGKKIQIEIFDFSGKRMLYEADYYTNTIFIGHLEPGVYILKIVSGKEISTTRFLKQ